MLDMGRAPESRRAFGRGNDLGSERLIELLLRTLEHEAQPVEGQVLIEPPSHQLGGVIADGARGLIDPPGGRFANRLTCVENPIDSGDADACRLGQIGDCRSPPHRDL